MPSLNADAIGARVADARSRVGMTQAQLASAVSPQEPGAPSIPIDRLAERATRNVEFLLGNDPDWKPPELPHLNRPHNNDDSEIAAATVRSALGLSPADPLYNAAETGASRLGLFAFSFEMGIDTADAASILLERGAVALINGSMQVGRRRLALAHEMGHCVFADEYSLDWRVSENDDSSAWEARVDRFARALLLPPQGIREAWNECRERRDDLRRCAVLLASIFRVDMSTLARRLLELGHVDGAQADRIRHVRTTRADIVEMNLVIHDELAAPATPRAYDESVLRLFRAETISSARALDLLFDTWDEDDLPPLPSLPENAIWQFVS